MTHATRRSLLFPVLAVLALVAAGCGSGATIATPLASPSPAAPASVAPSVTPSVAVATAAPTATPAATPAPATACAVTPQTGNLPSDRFTTLKVTAGGDADQLTFHFGNPSLGPGGPPEGSLAAAEPPYTQGASGATIEVSGDRVLQVTFRGMSLQNDVGQETYTGPTEFKPDLPALRHAVMYDATEGVVGWYVGYDGGGCATLSQTNNDVILTIQHP
jgi:hypothetical protein